MSVTREPLSEAEDVEEPAEAVSEKADDAVLPVEPEDKEVSETEAVVEASAVPLTLVEADAVVETLPIDDPVEAVPLEVSDEAPGVDVADESRPLVLVVPVVAVIWELISEAEVDNDEADETGVTNEEDVPEMSEVAEVEMTGDSIPVEVNEPLVVVMLEEILDQVAPVVSVPLAEVTVAEVAVAELVRLSVRAESVRAESVSAEFVSAEFVRKVKDPVVEEVTGAKVDVADTRLVLGSGEALRDTVDEGVAKLLVSGVIVSNEVLESRADDAEGTI